MLTDRVIKNIEKQVLQNILKKSGRGKSKKDAKDNSSIVGANGHKVSPFVHADKSTQNVRSDYTNLAMFARDNYKQKIHQISKNTVKAWILSRNIKYEHMSNQIAALARYSGDFNVSREELFQLRNELLKTIPKTVRTKPRAYNVTKIDIKEIRVQFQPAFIMQRDYGLRVQEATYIRLNTSNRIVNINSIEKEDIGLHANQNIIVFLGKNGKIGVKRIDTKLTQQIIYHMKHSIYKVNVRTYSREIEKAINKSNQAWNGSHGLRHSYAQNMAKKGCSKIEISKMMNHKREEITNTYLR